MNIYIEHFSLSNNILTTIYIYIYIYVGCDNNRLDYAFEETWSLYCALDVSHLSTIQKKKTYHLYIYLY